MKDEIDKALDNFAEAGTVWDGVNPRTLRGAPDDDWAKFIAPENPIKEAKVCGENVSLETYSRQAPGVTRGHPDYILSRSDLMEFAFCPHRWVNGYRDEGSKSTEWGSLIDCLLMDPDSLEERFAIVPETYETTVFECPSCGSVTSSKTCKQCKVDRVEKAVRKTWNFSADICKQWREENSFGRQEVSSHTLKSARDAAQLLLDDEQIAEIFRSSRKQVMVTGFYDDSETGVRVPLRCLIDLVPPDKFLADLKTGNCAHPRAWVKHVHQYGYHIQAAQYLDIWNAATGEHRKEFRHIIQENFQPFESAKRALSSEFIALGRDRYLEALKRYARCIKSGEWPGYDDPKSHDVVIDGFLVSSPESWMVGV